MEYELIITPEAQAHVNEACAWYSARSLRLGSEFLDEARACMKSIREMPTRHTRIEENFRRAPMKRFPYKVFFKLQRRRVVVFGVFHNARHPDVWRAQAVK